MANPIAHIEMPTNGASSYGDDNIPVVLKSFDIYAEHGDWVVFDENKRYHIAHRPTGLKVGYPYTSIRAAKADLVQLPVDSGYSERPPFYDGKMDRRVWHQWQRDNNEKLNALKPALRFLYGEFPPPYLYNKGEEIPYIKKEKS